MDTVDFTWKTDSGQTLTVVASGTVYPAEYEPAHVEGLFLEIFTDEFQDHEILETSLPRHEREQLQSYAVVRLCELVQEESA